MNPCKVKICGTTSVADALLIAEAGADYSGVAVGIPNSERSISVENAASIVKATPIPSVVLFLDRSREWIKAAVDRIKPFAVQLLGHESPAFVASLKKGIPCQVWKSIFLPPAGRTFEISFNIGDIKDSMNDYFFAGADMLLLDTADVSDEEPKFGGTGKVSDWKIAGELIKDIDGPVFLAGGINPDNVREAIRTVRPYGIDLCSGVESAIKGIRDKRKVEKLLANIRE